MTVNMNLLSEGLETIEISRNYKNQPWFSKFGIKHATSASSTFN